MLLPMVRHSSLLKPILKKERTQKFPAHTSHKPVKPWTHLVNTQSRALGMAEGLLGKEYIRHDEVTANKKEVSCKWNKKGNKIHLPRDPWIMDGLDKAR